MGSDNGELQGESKKSSNVLLDVCVLILLVSTPWSFFICNLSSLFSSHLCSFTSFLSPIFLLRLSSSSLFLFSLSLYIFLLFSIYRSWRWPHMNVKSSCSWVCNCLMGACNFSWSFNVFFLGSHDQYSLAEQWLNLMQQWSWLLSFSCLTANELFVQPLTPLPSQITYTI